MGYILGELGDGVQLHMDCPQNSAAAAADSLHGTGVCLEQAAQGKKSGFRSHASLSRHPQAMRMRQ